MARKRRENNDTSLIIDRAAAAEIPTPEATREWAADKRVFISSVMSELAGERRSAADAVRAVGARPVMFEQFGGRDADPEDAYLGEVETSNIYVGILGRQYGKPLRTRYSATHTEYRHAEQCGLRIAVWTLGVNEREGPQQSFLDEVRTFHVVPAFESPADLQLQVEDRLRTIAAEDLAPWVKLGSIIFRAKSVTHRGDTIMVKARVQSDDVAHALEMLGPGQYGRQDAAPFTWAGRSRHVQVAKIEHTTTTARSKTLELEMAVTEPRHDSLMDMSLNGMTPEDLTDLAFRIALFGEPNPLAKQSMGFMTEMADPLEPLRRARVPDEIIRPLTELMLVDSLVGSERGARITDFRLGASVGGLRRLEFTWEPRKRYSGDDRPKRRTVTGQVRL
jgi:hypothetical protein